MNKEKFQEIKQDLKHLLLLAEQSNVSKRNREKLDDLIVDTAAELIDVFVDLQKSEMPCNCCRERDEKIDSRQKMLAAVEAVDAFITAINKLANQKKF